MPTETLFHRPLPPDLVDFSAPEGRVLLREALAAGTAESFFPLMSRLHTQAEPEWCGLGTLVTVLNALEIDPGRVWKGPWRWFGEELLDCCKSLDAVRAEGLTLGELACLARCNGAAARVRYADDQSSARFLADLEESVRAPAGPFIACNYARPALGQTGTGHFSPVAAWHEVRGLALVLDVARFKYPPHWVPVSRLIEAMSAVDSATGAPRGWAVIERPETAAEVDPQELAALTDRLTALGVMRLPCPPPRQGA